jgi:hypothetical protein
MDGLEWNVDGLAAAYNPMILLATEAEIELALHHFECFCIREMVM